MLRVWRKWGMMKYLKRLTSLRLEKQEEKYDTGKYENMELKFNLSQLKLKYFCNQTYLAISGNTRYH
jgi:hypothetical protein